MTLRVSDYTRAQKRMLAGDMKVSEWTAFEKQWRAEHPQTAVAQVGGTAGGKRGRRNPPPKGQRRGGAPLSPKKPISNKAGPGFTRTTTKAPAYRAKKVSSPSAKLRKR